jgi:enterochelin esterase-like enzyme
MVPQHISNLRRYEAIAIAVGDRDGLLGDNRDLHEMLERLGVSTSFKVYPGDHGSGVSMRFGKEVVPFFSNNLQF